MKWIDRNEINDFFNMFNYDVRISGNGRWIDQKCTPDVLTIIADCIVDYTKLNGEESIFTSMDIWHSEYAENNILSIFKKPNPNNLNARNEYDKFFQQPMELLAYSNVLTKIKKGNRNYYKVNSKDLLLYISLREKNSLFFLVEYITKVLRDSELLLSFEMFFIDQSPEGYDAVKKEFGLFTKKYTKINGDLECGRIFTKVLNPLAFERNKLGTEKGRISRGVITLDMLMYNRDNFRDIFSHKPKDLTREEYIQQLGWKPNNNYQIYSSKKAKKYIRLYNDEHRNSLSEVDYNLYTEKAIQIHHIFPESRYPEIAAFLENLIALTPNQHYINAHPCGNTSLIDREYQAKCLKSKYESIMENYNSTTIDTIYELQNFLIVLDRGYGTDIFSQIDIFDKEQIFVNIDKYHLQQIV